MRWPPYKHIFFDCDSTLTTVEGIDILADIVGKKWRVEVLTNAAMDGLLNLEDVYSRRLRAINPTHDQIREVTRIYKRHIVEDARQVIAALQTLGHEVYIISGGLAEPVREVGIYLGVPPSHIRAVNIDYNQLSGHWWLQKHLETDKPAIERYLDYEEGALTVSNGKAQIIRELLGKQHGRALLIGDGSSDYLASQAVDLFVGFGGVVQRTYVREQAPIYLHSPTLAPLLTLAAGPAAHRFLQNTPYIHTFDKGIQLIKTGALSFNNDRLKSKLIQAINSTYQTIHPRP